MHVIFLDFYLEGDRCQRLFITELDIYSSACNYTSALFNACWQMESGLLSEVVLAVPWSIDWLQEKHATNSGGDMVLDMVW